MTTYQKIPGLYKFDSETRTYDKETFSTPELEALRKAPIWLFTEKVDGTNIRVIWDGYRVKFAGRTDNAQIPPKLLDHLNEKFGGPDNERLFEEKFGVPESGYVVLYGEGFGAGIQKGGKYRSDTSFVLFDVKIGDLWLNRESQEDITKFFQTDLVPLVFSLPLPLISGIELVQNTFHSAWQNDPKQRHIAEGLVATTILGLRDRRGNRIAVKIKDRDLR